VSSQGKRPQPVKGRRGDATAAGLEEAPAGLGLEGAAQGSGGSRKGEEMTETASGRAARGDGKGARKGTSGGLKVRRVHTRPGIHPYDEVTWERRDVVLTNWRDGSVNFEQRGVEFPDFWSVNAANIVTTKYFRGAVGTPQREWSLKQLIDRVIGVYVATAKEHSYFATDEDAGIFEDELKHALVHQIFSFNSPVWFNVGTTSPQQVSACQPYDALVSTPAGLIPIGELVEGDAIGAKVYDAHGLTRIVATKANGVKDVLRLHTKAGYTVDVTADHLVWRAENLADGVFVEAGTLRPGNHLLRIDPEVGGLDRQLAEIVGIEPLGAMEVYDIQTESGEYLSSNLRVHNCFILAVDDTMDSILDWYKEEGLIFKGGSGSGVNLSRIRSSKELLSSGGTASGPVSFMRGADASAGTIKSGGATRRAAKMVVLDIDHPDVAEFIETKAREEEKIRVLRDAGFDMDLGGKDIASVQYQNANNSVRVSDEFMRAVESGGKFDLLARQTGERIEQIDAKTLFRKMAQAAWECADPGIQYDDTINGWHTCPESGRITASNPCSEYVHLDNSSCNLASINLMKFLRDDDTFDTDRFAGVVELVITAMDISITFADFPTKKIAETTRAFRQLGIGYANLGALLMATGHAYDSPGGRTIAAAITSLMTAAAYRRSAELAAVVGPYEGYARNAAAHARVTRRHAAANEDIRTLGGMDQEILAAAAREWRECLVLGEKNGYRNAQASLLAPTGCLTGDSLITTGRGLARLSELGEEYGDRWQDIEFVVSTDDGPRLATRFFVNGEEPTRVVRTEGGYKIQGTLAHRVKVVDAESGDWRWKRLADIAPGDVVPMQLGTMVGTTQRVPLPVLDQAYYTGDHHLRVPDQVTPELAELAGYFMGDGSLHAKGIRLCVADTDPDVAERLGVLSKAVFGLEPVVTAQDGYREVLLSSVRLARWWQAAGLAKNMPGEGHHGKGWVPRVPSAVLESNDPAVYTSFLRGLFEADGTVLEGVPSVSTANEAFAGEVRTLLLALGLATTTRETRSGWGGPIFVIRLRNIDHALNFDEHIGFIGERKASLMATLEPERSAKKDYVFLPRAVWEELVPVGNRHRDAVTQSLRKSGGVARMLARLIFEETFDERLGEVLAYLFERIASNEDGGVQPTYDLSVPENVTYVANGLVSHNTIGLMMDCDTTGIEPDLALVKFKKLVGGGSMQIVNQTVPRALTNLGYQPEQVEATVEYISEHGHVVDAPGLRREHYEVFDCAMGERAIKPMGHVRMVAAVQPFLSGAISKTVNMPESATVEEIEGIYLEGWKLGLKALAIYRDNCKVGQPLSDARKKTAVDAAPSVREATSEPHEIGPVRRRLPKQRKATVTSFSVGGAEGYMTASSYPDNGLGEVFLKLGKQGSTLAGVMDAFSVAISISLQYGVPLRTWAEKFTNMRFEPAGLTDDPDIRIASSVMDYIFRRLALDHLPYDERAELGILSAAERSAQLAGEDPAELAEEDPEAMAQSAPVEHKRPERLPQAAPAAHAHSSMELIEEQQGRTADAPLCLTCGTKMRPAGSCYVCEGCGATSGCS
jgi:ribonucleoside-diphosphate reductase alpha chain